MSKASREENDMTFCYGRDEESDMWWFAIDGQVHWVTDEEVGVNHPACEILDTALAVVCEALHG